jgi:DNA mismatch repair protein MutS
MAPGERSRIGQEHQMAHQGTPQVDAKPTDADQPAAFGGLLSEKPESLQPDCANGSEDTDGTENTELLADLRLDLVIEAVAGERDERDFITALLRRRVRDEGTLRYRHEVFADLEDPAVVEAAQAFCGQMQQVRAHLAALARMRSSHQRAGWFLDAAAIYCDAIRALAAGLDPLPISSRALQAFRDYLAAYMASAEFTRLASDTADRRKELAQVTYLVRVKGPKVEVSRYDGEPDYSAEIEATFERFRQGAVKDYRVRYRSWPSMNHVGEQILGLVARLFSDEFAALAVYFDQHAGFMNPKIAQFDREIQFYLAYLEYIGPLRVAGLSFCLPEVSASSKEVFASDTFDLPLAAKLVSGRMPVIPNDFELRGQERVIVVTGPNQGGKTTFARTFGQLHHLAALGCPVPGITAKLFLPGQIFTHFEREEDIANLTGKLEDDLLRIQKVLRAATADSIVIMNEIFTSTTVSDALFLGRKVLTKVVELDLLCVYVTFIDELTSFSDTVVSMASTVVPDDPASRTFKVVRKPADGLAYALAIARKHRVTYELLRGRVAR